MRSLWIVFARELKAYFTTPLAYIFLIIFLTLAGGLTFKLGGFFERDRADLNAFFAYLPWLLLFLMPAIGMRLWAEERGSGTIELLLTLPVTTGRAVAGKFLAAWAFAILALALTTPLWATIALLGQPDHGVVATGYLGGVLMAGGFLALCSTLSAATSNQVVAFILGAAVCFLFLMSGLPLVQGAFQGWAPQIVGEIVASLSFLNHFHSLARGLVDLRSLIYFGSLIVLALMVNTAVIDLKKGS